MRNAATLAMPASPLARPVAMALSSHLVREPCVHAARPARALAGRAAVCSSGAPLLVRRIQPCSASAHGARRDLRVMAVDTGERQALRAEAEAEPASRGVAPDSLTHCSPPTEDADAELEKRLAAFKGTRDWKDVRSEREGKAKSGEAGEKASSIAPVDEASWAGETVFYEGPPSRGDLAVNVLLGVTLLWLARLPPGCGCFRPPGSLPSCLWLPASPPLSSASPHATPNATQPLSLAAVGKALWVYYKVTDKRVSVKSTSPFGGSPTPPGRTVDPPWEAC